MKQRQERSWNLSAPEPRADPHSGSRHVQRVAGPQPSTSTDPVSLQPRERVVDTSRSQLQLLSQLNSSGTCKISQRDQSAAQFNMFNQMNSSQCRRRA